MEWAQVLIMLGTLAGLFLWNRSEANSDRRMFQQILIGIQDEMKDFHAKLIAIEERTRK